MAPRFRYYSRSIGGSAARILDAITWLTELADGHGIGEPWRSELAEQASGALSEAANRNCDGDGDSEIELGVFIDQGAATLMVMCGSLPSRPSARIIDERDAEVLAVGSRTKPAHAPVIDARIGSRTWLMLRIGPCTAPPARDRRLADRSGSLPLMRGDGRCVELDHRRIDQSDSRCRLSETALFRGVPDEVIDSLLAYCELRTAVPDEILFHAGEYHRCVLVNLEGSLRVHLDAPSSDFHLELGTGESVGELSVCDGKPVSAWVKASSLARLLVIPEPVFLEIVLAVPRIARNLVSLMAERMRTRDAHVIERARARMELEAIQRELHLARQIQSNMLPLEPLLPGHSRVRARGFMRAAKQVGGDFYDAFSLSDGRVFAAIGDVCGKGMPAALFMVRTLTSMRGEATRTEEDPATHLARLADRCNELLNESNEAQLFVTMFCAIVDVDLGRVHFVNAGHNPPLLRLPGEGPSFLDQPRNPVVGVIPGIRFTVGSCAFPLGSLLVLYTDGVTEARNSAGAMFEDEALRALVDRQSITGADECVNGIVKSVDEFAGACPQFDDLTVLAIQRT